MELSELFESLSFLQSSSSVLLSDLFGLGGLCGAPPPPPTPPPSPAALGFLAGIGGLFWGSTDSSCVFRQDISLGSSPSLRQLLPPMGSSPELRYTRDIDLQPTQALDFSWRLRGRLTYLGCFSEFFLEFVGVVMLEKVFVLW